MRSAATDRARGVKLARWYAALPHGTRARILRPNEACLVRAEFLSGWPTASEVIGAELGIAVDKVADKRAKALRKLGRAIRGRATRKYRTRIR